MIKTFAFLPLLIASIALGADPNCLVQMYEGPARAPDEVAIVYSFDWLENFAFDAVEFDGFASASSCRGGAMLEILPGHHTLQLRILYGPQSLNDTDLSFDVAAGASYRIVSEEVGKTLHTAGSSTVAYNVGIEEFEKRPSGNEPRILPCRLNEICGTLREFDWKNRTLVIEAEGGIVHNLSFDKTGLDQTRMWVIKQVPETWANRIEDPNGLLRGLRKSVGQRVCAYRNPCSNRESLYRIDRRE